MSDSTTTLIARAALAGFAVRKEPDGTWVAERWGHLRSFANQQEVERWLELVAGKRAA